ncbi:MAG: acyl carrier protein [Gemmatimonadales bacterium]|nr:acyl carrier protein [Gemmatimonadales bacterium]
MEDIQGQVKQYILATFLKGEDPSALRSDTPLITGGILDSLATLELVSFLEQKFSIQFEAHEVDAERLDTLDAITAMVQGKMARV